MSDNVISIGDRRVAKSPTLLCGCGSAWFTASVCFEGQQVSGYGVPVKCVECAQEVTP